LFRLIGGCSLFTLIAAVNQVVIELFRRERVDKDGVGGFIWPTQVEATHEMLVRQTRVDDG